METTDNFAQMGYEDYQEMMENSNHMKKKVTTGNFIKLYIKAIIDIQKDEDVKEEMLKQIVDVVKEFENLWKDAKMQKKKAQLAELHLNYFLKNEEETE